MGILNQITSGKIDLPHLLLIYGPDGVGKSTFAASAPKPLFIGSEFGTANLDVARITVTDFPSALKALEELATVEHNYQTIVIDSLDWMEPLVWKYVCEINKWTSIEQPGFGRGYAAAIEQWGGLVERLRAIREKRRLNIILIAHSQVRQFQDPQTQVGYDRYELKLNGKASGLFREFVDTVLFANFEVFATKEKNDRKTKTFGDGARFAYTERRPPWDAKNRFGLPLQIPFSWDDYLKAKQKSTETESPDALIKRIEEMALTVKDEKIRTNIANKLKEFEKDTAKLLALKNKVLTLVSSST